ncbi:MAG: peptide deformylase [Campylobacterota bacterium]|nr:peptide deformylase [Campylobacterota bacterium]
MIKKIIQYPTVESLEFGGTVRHFDETLLETIQDLKDTITENNLEALSAFQIGSALAVFVIKQEDGSFLEIVNPVIITREGSITPIETTAYFPGLSAKTKRYEKIKITYEDKTGKQQFLTAEGNLAILIQRKCDYLLGSNFRIRLDKEEQKLFDAKLEYGTDAFNNNNCPTTFKRDILLTLIKYGVYVGILGIIVGLFLSPELIATLKTVENYLITSLFVLVLVYFFYAQYEGKKYTNCSSCQLGNIAGTALIQSVKLFLLFLANTFML